MADEPLPLSAVADWGSSAEQVTDMSLAFDMLSDNAHASQPDAAHLYRRLLAKDKDSDLAFEELGEDVNTDLEELGEDADECFYGQTVVPDLGVAVGLVSIVVSMSIGIPQTYKIIRRQSSRGVSFQTLFIGNLGAFVYIANIFILHYNQIKSGLLKGGQEWGRSQKSIMFLYVEVFNTLSQMMIYPVAWYYARDVTVVVEGKRFRKLRLIGTGAWTQLVLLLAIAAPILKMVFTGDSCSSMETYAQVLGYLVIILSIFKYFPQLELSYFAKGSHSLSYMQYVGDAAGGLVAVLTKIYVTKEKVSTWAPPLTAHMLQVIIISLNISNDYKYKRGVFAPEDPEQEALTAEGKAAPALPAPPAQPEAGTEEEKAQYGSMGPGEAATGADTSDELKLKLRKPDVQEMSQQAELTEAVYEEQAEHFNCLGLRVLEIDNGPPDPPPKPSTTAVGKFLDKYL